MLPAQRQRAAIAGRERGVLTGAAAVPDRTDGMDHMPRRQRISIGDLGVAGGAAIEAAARGEQVRTCGAMDRAVDSAAAEQRAIGGIDDRVERERRDVGDDDLKRRRADLACEGAQAAALMPLSVNSFCNSPAWNISRMMSQPPTNSPFT